jgi:cytochrome P450
MESGNRDEAKFQEPDRFDIRRKNSRDHLCFGYGMHHCVGSALARREMALAFPRLLERLVNIRLLEERSDLRRHPSVLLRALNSLYIEFEPGKRQVEMSVPLDPPCSR